MTIARVEPVTRDDAIRRLREAGRGQEASELENYEDKNGQGLGWDGWIRGAHPDLVDVIWAD